jgi:hypothetical protein
MFPATRKPNKPAGQGSVERYASGSVLARFEAVLVMDSRDTTSSVRSQAFAGGWSRLYQAGAYYLDLSLKQDGDHTVLMGHVLPPVGEHQVKGQVRISEQGGEKDSNIGPAGDFRLEVKMGELQSLEVELETVRLSISDLGITA